MIHHILRIVLIVLCLCLRSEVSALSIAIFSAANGSGLQLDRQVLRNELEQLGHTVLERDFLMPFDPDVEIADINIFFEYINTSWTEQSSLNWFVPNPEWYIQELSCLQSIDLILCRTKEVERIFKRIALVPTFFLGFTTKDPFDPLIQKDFSRAVHIAGKSHYKGTASVVEAWKMTPHMHPMTIVYNNMAPPAGLENVVWISQRLAQRQLLLLQNGCGVHICPSETEGFGHYILEAMAAGAVVITTDAPPMNEFILDRRCLVPWSQSAPCLLATMYHVDGQNLARSLQQVLRLSDEEKRKIGRRNRERFLRWDKRFRKNLQELLLL